MAGRVIYHLEILMTKTAAARLIREFLSWLTQHVRNTKINEAAAALFLCIL
jgi:hypothetical protein